MTKKTYKIFDVENLDITKSNRVALGNSFLEMVFLSDKHVIESEKTIRAVINDQPNISISSTWEDSPMTSIGQNISRFLQNPIIDSVAQQSVNYQKLTLTDEYSKKFYAGISDITFDISFRLYQDSFFKTTNPIIAFKNIINALLPKKTFNFSDAFSNIEDAFNLTSIAGSKAINSFSTAYNQLSSIIDSDGGKTTMNILNNLASDINSVMSSVAKNQALGNSYFLLKLGYDLLGFAYPMEVVCTNSSFEFSKQTWYNETQKKYQPYFIDFNMSFTTLCTPSLNTWKKYINGANDSSLSKIQEQNVKISQNPIKIDELNTNAINEAVLQEIENKTGIKATRENTQTANNTYKLLRSNIENTVKENKNQNYTAKPILTIIQAALREGEVQVDLADQINLSDYEDIFEYDNSGKVTIKDQVAADVILNIDTNNGKSILKNETLTNAAVGRQTYGNSGVSLINTETNDLELRNGNIITNNQSIPVTFREE